MKKLENYFQNFIVKFILNFFVKVFAQSEIKITFAPPIKRDLASRDKLFDK